MVAIENVLLAAESVFALVLTVIAVLALRRAKDVHLAYLAAAFGVFFLKALVLTISLFALSLPPGQIFLLSGSLDLVILALFYGFALRRFAPRGLMERGSLSVKTREDRFDVVLSN